MDNEVIIKIEGVEYQFKLKSSSILYLEKKLGRNIFEAFQNPDFTVMVNIFYACASNECKAKYGNEGDLFDALLAEYGMQELAEKYLAEIVQKSGLVQKQDIPTPSGENKEKTWNK
jgi:hypothetical protein